MDTWYYAKNGQQHGPVSLGEVNALLRQGGLGAADLVWNPSMKDWLPVSQVPELSQAASPPPPHHGLAPSVMEFAATGAGLAEISPGSDPVQVGSCIKRGFEVAKRNIGSILLVGAVYVGVLILTGILLSQLDAALGLPPINPPTRNAVTGLIEHHPQSALNVLLSNLVSLFLMLGITRVGLNLVSGKSIVVSQLFGEGDKLLRAIIASLVFGLMVVVGILLFVIPGIYLALRYGQFLTAIVDRDLGIMEAFRYSSAITTNNRLNLLVYGFVSIFVLLAGLLALMVGLLIAYPTVWLGYLVAYRWMQYGHNACMDDPVTKQPLLAGNL